MVLGGFATIGNDLPPARNQKVLPAPRHKLRTALLSSSVPTMDLDWQTGVAGTLRAVRWPVVRRGS